MGYQFAICSPVRKSDGAATNNGIFAAPCLGIEITEPELAARCVLGNVDPQHTEGRLDTSAIRACLDLPLPPANATLVTLRPDADAIGAMAVLALRSQGAEFTGGALERIALIDRADRFANGSWPSARPLPQSPDEIDELGLGPQGHGAMILLAADRDVALETKIAAFADWIVYGIVPETFAAKAQLAAAELFDGLQSGRVVVSEIAPGRLALVRGGAPGALRLGYRMAPVVIAEDEASTAYGAGPHRRVTIAQYTERHADFPNLLARLRGLQPGWGGSPAIIGSPQGVACKTATDEIVRQVMDSLRQPAV